MKKRKDNGGFLLVESLVSLSIMSLIIVVMVTSLTQMFQTIRNIQIEVEGWRYFQDSVNTDDSAPRTSDGNVMVWQKSAQIQTVTIESSSGKEVLSVEIYD